MSAGVAAHRLERSSRRVLLRAAIFLVPCSALAMGNDTLFLNASAGLVFDSNVLGITSDVPESVSAAFAGSRQKSSWIQEYGAGVRADLPVSRQRFLLDVAVTRYLYDNFPELDYTGYLARGSWNWSAGNDWSGQLSGSFDESRQVIESARAVNVPVLTRNYQVLVDAHHTLTARWEVIGALGATRLRYSADELRGGDLDTTLESIGALYRTPAGNATGLRLTLEQGDSPHAEGGRDSSYDQYTLAALLDWGVSGRSRLSGDIGYTSRRVTAPSGSSEDGGVSGRLSYDYSVSGKTRVQATAYQLFGPLGDPAQSSVRTRGVDLSATYQATAKSTFTAYATRKTIEFLGGASGAEEQGREDRYTIVGVSAQYAATRTLTAWAGADYQKRDSNLPLTAYDVYTVFLRAKLEF